MNDLAIASVIYILFTAYFMVRDYWFPITGDRVREYTMLHLLLTNQPLTNDHKLLKSCVTTTYLPILLSRISRINPYLMFRITPALFHSLLPTFMFLAARTSFNIVDSLLVSAIVSVSFSVLYYTDNGRVGISAGLLAGLYYGVITNQWPLIALFSLAITVSHYGTLYNILFIFGGTWVVGLFTGQDLSLVMAFILVSRFFWFDIVFPTVAPIANGVIIGSFQKDDATFTKPMFAYDTPDIMKMNYQPLSGDKSKDYWRLELRDPIIRVALGMTLKYMSWMQRIEWSVSWVMVAIICISMVRDLMNPDVITILGLFAGVGLIISILIPHVSKWYGVSRTYEIGLVFWSMIIVRYYNGLWMWILLGVFAILISGLFRLKTKYKWFIDAKNGYIR